MLELKKYSTKELQQALSIPVSTWDRRKKEYLEHLKLYFDYTIEYQGKYTYFNITHQYAEFEPLPRKRDADAIKKFYEEETKSIVIKERYNTGSGVARTIIKQNNKYQHKVSTATTYIRPVIRNNYIPLYNKSKWMRINDSTGAYVELSQAEVKVLNNLFKDVYGVVGQQALENEAAVQAGYMTREEAQISTGAHVATIYTQVMDTFMEEFGFRPIKVAYLEDKAPWEEK